MTRKDLETRYDIIGRNNDIALFRNKDEYSDGVGYWGSVALKNGKAAFNGKSYADLDSLDNALVEYAKTLPYPVDTYNPLINEGWRVESRILWYLTEKLGFTHKYREWESVYVKSIGPFYLEFYIKREMKDDKRVCIVSKYGSFTFRSSVDNAEDGIASMTTIVNTSILGMAKDMVDAISYCPENVLAEIDAFIPSNKNILGVEKVSFKDMMIYRLESQLKALKEG